MEESGGSTPKVSTTMHSSSVGCSSSLGHFSSVGGSFSVGISGLHLSCLQSFFVLSVISSLLSEVLALPIERA